MYQALYRKWRPKSFSDVVGQVHITKTLQNELKSGRIAHAYLFLGSRGTGKTTCAKILAKAVNCLFLDEGNPCQNCEICKAIDNGSLMDIVELDAASNNSVNDIREICEAATFTPSKAKYRVYIIDEVHMLSTGAFNALLKTLEEPPAHVIFILATTEAHKVPATILSRCQRFEFHKISTEDIVNRLQFVANEDKILLEEDAAILIARICDGALRDALSILDKCIGMSNKVTLDIVAQVAGIVSSEKMIQLCEFILNGSIGSVLKIIDELNSSSKDMVRICDDLISYFRIIMLIKTMKEAKGFLIMPQREYESLSEIAKGVSVEEIIFMMDTLQASFEKMNKGCNNRVELEMCIVKLCTPSFSEDNQALLARLEKLERVISRLENEESLVEPKSFSYKPEKKEEDSNPYSEVAVEKPLQKQTENKEANFNSQENSVPSPAVDTLENLQKSATKMQQWGQVLEVLKGYSTTMAMAFQGSSAYVSGDFVLIDAASEMAFELLRKSAQRDKMRLAIKDITGHSYKLGPYNIGKAKKRSIDPLEELANAAKKSGIEVIKK